MGGCAGVYAGNQCPVCSSPAWAKDLNVNRQVFMAAKLFHRLDQLLNGKNEGTPAAEEVVDFEDDQMDLENLEVNAPENTCKDQLESEENKTRDSEGKKNGKAGADEPDGGDGEVDASEMAADHGEEEESPALEVRALRSKTAESNLSPLNKSAAFNSPDSGISLQASPTGGGSEGQQQVKVSKIKSSGKGKKRSSSDNKAIDKTPGRSEVDRPPPPVESSKGLSGGSKVSKGASSGGTVRRRSERKSTPVSSFDGLGQSGQAPERSSSTSGNLPGSGGGDKQPARTSAVAKPFSLMKRNAKGETPLHLACIKGNLETARKLLESGVDPNVKDNAGWTPLHEACNHGNGEIVELLLDHGALVNIPGFGNDTPLHDAVQNQRLDVVRILIERGASQELRNKDGKTPQDYAVTGKMKQLLRTTKQLVQLPESHANSPGQGSQARSAGRVVLLATGLKRDQKNQLDKCAALLKGKVVSEFSAEVSHLVAASSDDCLCARTMKYLQAILLGKWIIGFSWVKSCLENKEKTDELYFEITGTIADPFTFGPRNARLNFENQYPGLFDGCHFYFHGNRYAPPTPSHEELVKLVRLGGGQVLSREPKPGADLSPAGLPFHTGQGQGQGRHRCTHYVVYHQGQQRPHAADSPWLGYVPISWLMASISQFSLQELP